jgi:hypothetical protein
VSLGVFGEMNWIAAVGAGFIYFVLGAIWYAPGVFGKPWREAIGVAEDYQPGPLAIAGTLAACLVVSIFTGALTQATGADGIIDGLMLGIVLGLGVSGAILAAVAAVGPVMPRPAVFTVVTGGYHSVGLMIASLFVTVWS